MTSALTFEILRKFKSKKKKKKKKIGLKLDNSELIIFQVYVIQEVITKVMVTTA